MKIKVAMIYPDRESEKAISGYSQTLVEKIREEGFEINKIHYKAGSFLSLLRKFKEFKKYDIIHIQHEYNLLGLYGLPFFPLYFFLALCSCKVVTTMHTVLSQKEKFKDNLVKNFLRRFLYLTQNRWVNWNSDKIVVHANFFKNILANEYGVSREKAFVFPQGVIENMPPLNKEKIKKELNLSGKVYLLIGSMVPDHGQDIIIRQADKIGKTVLVVANPGSVNDRNTERTRYYLEENKQLVKKENLEKFVRFDIIDITDKHPLWWKYFIASDLVILPYKGGIGSGIFAHSMAAQTPVIASNIQFFRELSKTFGCVKIAKGENDYPRIIKSSMQPKNLKKMKNECKKYLHEYGLSTMAKKYVEVYERLLK